MTTKQKIDEVGAMRALDEALSALSETEKVRVLRWAWDKFGDSKPSSIPKSVPRSHTGVSHQSGDTGLSHALEEGEALGDFYARASATTEPERSLIVAYWLQELRGDGQFDAQSVNNELKHLGHGVSNITRALDELKSRKPQLVIQTQKSGKAKQARKVYKVTAEGKKEVSKMLQGQQLPEA